MSVVDFVLARLDEDCERAMADAERDGIRADDDFVCVGAGFTVTRRWLVRLRERMHKRAIPDPHARGECPDCDVFYTYASLWSTHPDYRPMLDEAEQSRVQ